MKREASVHLPDTGNLLCQLYQIAPGNKERQSLYIKNVLLAAESPNTLYWWWRFSQTA